MAKKSSFLNVVKGRLTQKKGGKDKEIEKYEKILEEQVDDRNALNSLGDLHAKRGDAEKACEYYLRVGALYAKDGFTLKSIAVYKKAQRARPNQVTTYLELADLYVQKGLIGEAKSNYLTAAEMQAEAGEKHESLETYRRIADLDLSNIKIRTKLAAMYESEDFIEDAAAIYVDIGETVIRGNIREAQKYYQRALELQAENEEILSRIGYSYAEHKMRSEATQIFDRLLKIFPGNIDYKEQLEILSETETASQEMPASSGAIEISEEELTSLNFGDEESSQDNSIDVEVEDASSPAVTADGHTLDFQIEDQGAISWDNTSGEQEQEVSFSPPVSDAPEHTLDVRVDESSPSPSHEPSSDSSGFFDLASRLDTSVQFEQTASQDRNFSAKTSNVKVEAPEQLATSEISDIVKEFKQGVLEEVGSEDYETHYELGISYKEMALIDDAIEELKLASLEPSKFVECQSVIALCYAEKGDYDQAIQALQEARARVDERGERYQDLTYQIAISYEQGGRTGEAVHIFQELFQINPGYRDVKNRLNKLLA